MVFRYSSVPAPLSASAVMRAAREAGASWAEISAVLGMSKQGAQNLYRRKIADQERYVGGLHDGKRRNRIPSAKVDSSPWQAIGDDN